MFEYVCARIIPGCTYTDKDESRDELTERVTAHFEQKHPESQHDERIGEALQTTGITFIRPV